MEGGREGGRDGWREGGREGGRERAQLVRASPRELMVVGSKPT